MAIIRDETRVARLLDDLVAAHESQRREPWANELPAEFRAQLQRAIVAFEIPVERIEGKFKLSQNRPTADQQSALEGVAAEASGAELGAFWRQVLERSLTRPPRDPGAGSAYHGGAGP